MFGFDNRRAGLGLAILLCGCAIGRHANATAPGGGAQSSVDSDETYADMGVAAASRIKTITKGKTVGMIVPKDRSTLKSVINSVIETYGFREVLPGAAQVACAPKPIRGVRVASNNTLPTAVSCSYDVADVILQLNSLQISGDSGYVGGYVSEVLQGEDRPTRTAFCLVSVRHGAGWIGATNSVVELPRDCASDRKH